jgi:hypothetical protein
MKNAFKISIIFLLFFCASIFAQEPLVFHFNFSFEKELWRSYRQWELTDDIENITVKIHDQKRHLVWERNFTKNGLQKDDYGYCLLSDTVKNLKKSKHNQPNPQSHTHNTNNQTNHKTKRQAQQQNDKTKK